MAVFSKKGPVHTVEEKCWRCGGSGVVSVGPPMWVVAPGQPAPDFPTEAPCNICSRDPACPKHGTGTAVKAVDFCTCRKEKV